MFMTNNWKNPGSLLLACVLQKRKLGVYVRISEAEAEEENERRGDAATSSTRRGEKLWWSEPAVMTRWFRRYNYCCCRDESRERIRNKGGLAELDCRLACGPSTTRTRVGRVRAVWWIFVHKITDGREYAISPAAAIAPECFYTAGPLLLPPYDIARDAQRWSTWRTQKGIQIGLITRVFCRSEKHTDRKVIQTIRLIQVIRLEVIVFSRSLFLSFDYRSLIFGTDERYWDDF